MAVKYVSKVVIIRLIRKTSRKIDQVSRFGKENEKNIQKEVEIVPIANFIIRCDPKSNVYEKLHFCETNFKLLLTIE